MKFPRSDNNEKVKGRYELEISNIAILKMAELKINSKR